MRTTSLRRITALGCAVLVALLATFASAAGDVLREFQKRYTKTAYFSEKEDVIAELLATGREEALRGFDWCEETSRAALVDRRKEAERVDAKLEPARQAFDKRWREYVAQERERGRPEPPQIPYGWKEQEELFRLQAESEVARRSILEEQRMVSLALDAQGRRVAKLPAEAQTTGRDRWVKGPLADRDWSARHRAYELLGHTPVDWALDVLVEAAAREPDPRALVAALDGIGGREAAKAVPPLVARLADARWSVRAAAVAALERTPSKETIDALVAWMAQEQGRLLDDCARALRTLTGADIGSNPEMWRNWWEGHRDQWTGPPPPAPKSEGLHPMAPPPEPVKDKGRTGFFGIETTSRRLVYVIDVSGSMHEPVGGEGPEASATRAELAKKELKQAIASLDDGVLFNIVFFSGTVRPWRPEMVVADVKARREAQEFTDAVDVTGGTATYDALEAAFAMGDVGKARKREADPTGNAKLDTVILLSDGNPTLGRSTKTETIRAAVREWNATRRVMVHTIAFGADADREFLRLLAEESGGTFRAR